MSSPVNSPMLPEIVSEEVPEMRVPYGIPASPSFSFRELLLTSFVAY